MIVRPLRSAKGSVIHRTTEPTPRLLMPRLPLPLRLPLLRYLSTHDACLINVDTTTHQHRTVSPGGAPNPLHEVQRASTLVLTRKPKVSGGFLTCCAVST